MGRTRAQAGRAIMESSVWGRSGGTERIRNESESIRNEGCPDGWQSRGMKVANDEWRMTNGADKAPRSGVRSLGSGVPFIRLNPTESDRSIFGTGVLPSAARAIKLNQIKVNQGCVGRGGWRMAMPQSARCAGSLRTATSRIRLRYAMARRGATNSTFKKGVEKTAINSE